jgi:hypothetical protein
MELNESSQAKVMKKLLACQLSSKAESSLLDSHVRLVQSQNNSLHVCIKEAFSMISLLRIEAFNKTAESNQKDLSIQKTWTDAQGLVRAYRNRVEGVKRSVREMDDLESIREVIGSEEELESGIDGNEVELMRSRLVVADDLVERIAMDQCKHTLIDKQVFELLDKLTNLVYIYVLPLV